MTLEHKVPPNLFKSRFRDGSKQPGLWLTLESPMATEVLAGAGYDWMLLDMEHTTVDPSQVAGHLRAAAGGTAELAVRIPWNEPVLVKRLLDAGARTLMFPCVQSAAEARAAVAATRYPPHGIRGVSGNMRANRFARMKDYAEKYQEEQCVIVQLESLTAIAAIEEIGAVDGVDALFIGPNDLAATMGLFGKPGAPEVETVIGEAIGRIKKTGKAAGILNYDLAQARVLFRDGFDFIAVNSDTAILARHSESMQPAEERSVRRRQDVDSRSFKRKTVADLRSQRWFSAPGAIGAHKHRRIKQAGFSAADFKDKPVIGILSTWSDFQTCHSHFPDRIQDIKRGIWQAGGFPAVIPLQSVSESFLRPTSMLYRNLLAMEAEEAIRAHPVDGVVLLGGCDKTGPGLVMGAASADVPAIFVPAGSMLKGRWRQHTLGTGSSTWAAEADHRAGRISDRDWTEMSEATVRSTGTCNTMGTASTMTLLIDVLGLSLPGASTIPAVDAAHGRMASDAGRRIVEMVWSDQSPSRIVTAAALQNAVIADMALSGSTNSLIHLIAMARRLGHDLSLDSFSRASERVPVICNLMPAGKYLMEDLHFAGGLMAVLDVIRHELDLSCIAANGRTLEQNLEGARIFDPDVIRGLEDPIFGSGAIVVLKGSLAPRGAVLKRSAAEPRLLDHVGPAVVFSNYDDLMARVDDPDLDISADSVMVLQEAGPIGAPGMPEWGMLPIPKKLLKEGVRDMVRISDGRMSGTSYGTCILHVCPESRIGGPLALVRNGDLIRLDAGARRLDLLVDDAEMAVRRSAWRAPAPHYVRGYGAMFSAHVLQADEGCDFDYLARGGINPEPEID